MSSARSVALGGFVSGLELGRLRLARRTSAVLWLTALALSLTIAWVEGSALAFDAASRTLHAVVSLVVPLSCFAITNLAHGATRLDDSTWSIARFGMPRRHLVLGVVGAAMLASMAVSLTSVELSLAVAYRGRSGWMSDALPSASLAMMGAAAYVAWFSFAASFGRRGRWIWLPLVLDFWLGDGRDGFAVMWPRAHLISLVGGDAVLDLPQRQSSVLLLAMAVVLAGAAAMLNSDG